MNGRTRGMDVADSAEPDPSEDANAPSPDVFIFGHRHHPVHAPLPRGEAEYLNLGDWLTHMTSAVIHEGKAELIDHKKGPQP